MLEAEAEDNSLRPSLRPTKFWPRGQLVLEDLTSLALARLSCSIRHLYSGQYFRTVPYIDRDVIMLGSVLCRVCRLG